MGTGRLLSLAAGVCPGVEPADFVAIAADAGWPACGIWFDPTSWTEATTGEVARRVADTGVVPLDIEPLFVRSDGDPGDAIIEAAAAIGARNILVVARGVERAAFVERFGQLCETARSIDSSLRLAIEFIPFFDIKTVGDAAVIVAEVGHPNAAVLVDNLHLARGGGRPADLAAVDPHLFPYAQACDAAAGTPTDLYTEAVDGRMLLGEGALPIAEFVRSLPTDTPLSLEIRSERLRADWPDPVERARHVLDTTTSFLTLTEKEPTR